MKKQTMVLVVLGIFLSIYCIGCGQTVRGAGKDMHRMGKGIKTIFISNNE